MNVLTLYCAIIVWLTFGAVNGATRDYYTAGVVEFRPIVSGMSSADMLSEHLHEYWAIMSSEEAQPVDIIVFPEGTLNSVLQPTYVPAPGALSVPLCDIGASAYYAEFIVTLSCWARNVAKYLVINLTEEEQCPATQNDTRPCAATGRNVYNTNVVFDREGRVVSRYRKVHTYMEAKNTTLLPEYAIFETDFGVRFGHFICFDINFYTPAQELVQRFGVHDFIFTSWFYSELPFLTAVQLQQAWAYGNDANVLAAGASYPDSGTTGSGIYAGTAGQLVTLMAGRETGGQRKLLTTRVPIYGTERPVEEGGGVIVGGGGEAGAVDARIDLPLMRDPQIENFISILLDANATALNETVCHGDQCCHFQLEWQPFTATPTLRYRIGVFNGERSYEEAELSNLKICALYACLNESVSSCALPPPSPSPSPSTPTTSARTTARTVHFRTVHISGEFPHAERMLLMPNSLTVDLLPLHANEFQWSTNNNNNTNIVVAQLALGVVDGNSTDLLTFAIYGNYYDKSVAMPSPLPPTSPSSMPSTSTSTSSSSSTDDDDDNDDDKNGGSYNSKYFTVSIMPICLCSLLSSTLMMFFS